MQNFLPIEKYREILDITPVCCVDVLFFNNDKTKTLLFKRNNEPLKDSYFSAGGRLLKNEKFEDCAIRQAFREVGINIKRDKLTFGGVLEEFHTNSVFEDISYHAVVIYYGYIFNDEDIKLDNQHSDLKWFSVSDDSINPFIKSRITSLLKTYGQKL